MRPKPSRGRRVPDGQLDYRLRLGTVEQGLASVRRLAALADWGDPPKDRESPAERFQRERWERLTAAHESKPTAR